MKTLEQVDKKVIQELKEKIALGCKILAKLELSDYLGHVSARIPETEYVLIKARGLDQGNLLNMTAEQVVIVDLEGRPVETNGLNPPDEVVLHTEVFKARPDVMGTVHTHQPISTIFGDLGKTILPMQGVMAAVCTRPDIPIFPSSRKIVTHEQAAAVAETLGDHFVCHLKNHGILTACESVEHAVVYAIWLEHQAKLTMYASMLGTPSGMSREEVFLNIDEAGPMSSRWKYYVSLLD